MAVLSKPKNLGPDHRVPVISRAITDSDRQTRSFLALIGVSMPTFGLGLLLLYVPLLIITWMVTDAAQLDPRLTQTLVLPSVGLLARWRHGEVSL